MRLYKKAAVCLLAAAMALSMMTACDGSNTPEPPSDSKPGMSEGSEEKPGGEEKPDTGKDDGDGRENSEGDSSGSSSGDSGAITWETSKAYKFGKKTVAQICRWNMIMCCWRLQMKH